MNKNILIFEVNNSLFAIDAINIELLTTNYKLENIPNKNNIHITYVNGKVIPVIDMYKYLFGINIEKNNNNKLVICNYQNKSFAFEVNNIQKLLFVTNNTKCGNTSLMVSGKHIIEEYIYDDGNLIGILDLDTINEEMQND